jgi:S-formylglutathione hydrolase
MKNLTGIITLVIVLFSIAQAHIAEGKLQIININAPSLLNNILDYKKTQQIAVYLPPSYDASTTKFPVIYFLPGYGDIIQTFINGPYYRVKSSMDNLIASGKIKEMIFVLINGVNMLKGTFYENSPVTGNWRDFVTKDVVQYIDSNYRTIPKRESRAICGHSMGGFGAYNIAMKEAAIFGLVYSISPGAFDQNGLEDQGMFSNTNTIKNYLAKIDEWSQLSMTDAINSYKTYMNSLVTTHWLVLFSYAYGASFSPDAEGYPPFVKYPYKLIDGQLQCDSLLLRNFEYGFGGIKDKVKQYNQNLSSLVDFTLEYGTQDEFSWIPRGTIYLSDQLKEEKIPHRLDSFTGGHENMVTPRIEQYMLPRLSEKLLFDDNVTSINQSFFLNNKFELYENYPNPFNPSTIISFDLSEGTYVKLEIYNVSGQMVKTLINSYKNRGSHQVIFNSETLSTGVYFYRLKTQDKIAIKKMLLIK